MIEYLKEEHRVLRGQVGGKRLRFADAQRRRLARKGKLVGLSGLRGVGSIVNQETILRWYRQFVARKYDGSARRSPGRPRIAGGIGALVVALATDNPTWGDTRIRDVRFGLGHEVGRTTIRDILKEQGMEPAPGRRRRLSWKQFLWMHWGAIAACALFAVEVLTLHGLVRYHVFFVIDLASRRVEVGGIAHNPGGAWMLQVVRNLLDSEDGLMVGKTHLIMDRDPVFTAGVRGLLRRGASSQLACLLAAQS